MRLEPGGRSRREARESLVASHLLKAAHWWTDVGFGSFDLCYLRDKARREVDFVVVRDGRPWFLVEAKSSGRRELTDPLRHFHVVLAPRHAF
ncbi:MAG: DUF4143 domain-containing protein [Candidatus Latescibacterota bacterium]